MSLTGPTLPWVLCICALASFGLLVWGVPHPRNVWLQRLMRAGLAALLCLSSLTYVGVRLNNQYQFYTSWSDLTGNSGSIAMSRHGAEAENTFNAPAQGAGLAALHIRPDAAHLQRVQGSRRVNTTITGEHSRVRGQVIVQLPPGYDPHRKQPYPVVFAYHGFPGHPAAYDHMGNFFGKVDAAIAAKRLAPTIFVMPQLNTPATLDTECVNVPGGQQGETWLATDLPQWVLTHFNVSRERTSWATYGYSFGGWCAAMIAMRHPDIFGAAVAIQGYFRPDFQPGFVPFSASSPLGRSYDLVALEKRSAPPIAVWTLASAQDNLSYPSSRAFLKAVHAPTSVTAAMLPTGGHRADVWVPYLPETLNWLGSTVPGFHPQHA